MSNNLIKPKENLKVIDNEGFYNPNEKEEFKGIFHGVDVEKRYYEAGAHFLYKDLYKLLNEYKESEEYKTFRNNEKIRVEKDKIIYKTIEEGNDFYSKTRNKQGGGRKIERYISIGSNDNGKRNNKEDLINSNNKIFTSLMERTLSKNRQNENEKNEYIKVERNIVNNNQFNMKNNCNMFNKSNYNDSNTIHNKSNSNINSQFVKFKIFENKNVTNKRNIYEILKPLVIKKNIAYLNNKSKSIQYENHEEFENQNEEIRNKFSCKPYIINNKLNVNSKYTINNDDDSNKKITNTNTKTNINMNYKQIKIENEKKIDGINTKINDLLIKINHLTSSSKSKNENMIKILKNKYKPNKSISMNMNMNNKSFLQNGSNKQDNKQQVNSLPKRSNDDFSRNSIKITNNYIDKSRNNNKNILYPSISNLSNSKSKFSYRKGNTKEELTYKNNSMISKLVNNNYNTIEINDRCNKAVVNKVNPIKRMVLLNDNLNFNNFTTERINNKNLLYKSSYNPSQVTCFDKKLQEKNDIIKNPNYFVASNEKKIERVIKVNLNK